MISIIDQFDDDHASVRNYFRLLERRRSESAQWYFTASIGLAGGKGHFEMVES